jgi:hypothetical protein
MALIQQLRVAWIINFHATIGHRCKTVARCSTCTYFIPTADLINESFTYVVVKYFYNGLSSISHCIFTKRHLQMINFNRIQLP